MVINIMKEFFRGVFILFIGIIILFVLFTLISINDTRRGIFNQDNYGFEKENIKILHVSINNTRRGIFNQDNYGFEKENIEILHGGIEQ